jgi:D-alanyl-lipoteichoic acid acyltransferase DltB (MBOAT superfamily)
VPSEVIAVLRNLPLVLTFLVFPALAGLALRKYGVKWRARWLAFCGLTMLPALCVLGGMEDVRLRHASRFIVASLEVMIGYIATVLISWLLLRRWGRSSGRQFWIAFSFPIAVLLLVRFVPGDWHYFYEGKHIAVIFIGVSYMAFRLSHLALECRNSVVPMPTLAEYLAFAFFPPTLAIGPISPFSTFRASLHDTSARPVPVLECVVRFVVGLTKYLFLAKLADQLAYQGLLLDSHPHPWIDLPVAALFYYLYLYLNFSGWCDMAIAGAGLLGIRVAENFNHPFRSRNVQEYWTRWHITLGVYMRDVLFTPLSKTMVRAFGPKNAQHAIAVSLMTVFLAMGLWHGLAWNFFIYYLIQGIGIVWVHYYTHFLKKRLGRDGYARYLANPHIRRAATSVNFAFACASLFFFANPLPQAARVLAVFG